jgi:hypothetical protein
MDVRTLLALMILEHFEAGKSGTACGHFVSKAGFMLFLFKVVVLVDLLVVLFVPVCGKVSFQPNTASIQSTTTMGNIPQKPIVNADVCECR